jgi:signal transduction histidine kinase
VEGTVQALRRFVADAAHQVQTPLTALRTDLELAQNEGGSRQQAEYLERASAQTQRLSELAQSLLDLSRLESGLSDLSRHQEQVDLARLVKETSEIYASQSEQKGQNFSVQTDAAVSSITGNEVLLRQAVGNLLDNAIKFTPTSGEIRVGVEEADQGVTIYIEDDGIGIPAEDKPFLFGRFHRGHNVSAYPGNGLGLAIVKAIVQAHGGEVWAEDSPKGGTRVSMRFPTR